MAPSISYSSDASVESELLAWQTVADQKQRERSELIQDWSKKILGTSQPRLPEPNVKDVRHWPKHSGCLSARQLAITGSVPTRILRMIARKIWSAEEVLIAFTINATLAHHLTNPLTDLFFEKALSRSKELDLHLAQTGQVVGPLHGLPLSLKDVMNVEGHATTFGFVAFADNKQQQSDRLVSHLHAAGAVLFCKTNVPQSLMSGECNNMLFGRTSTPDNRDLSAGGSSGGEGSLVALRGSPLGIGTDIAGSIRTPANFNGIYGLCPTYGRLPCHSNTGLSLGLINGVAGPLSSSVDGLELYTRTVLGFEPWKWDPSCVPLPWNSTIYTNARTAASAGQLCFGFVAHDAVVRPDPPIERGLLETKEALRRAGHDVVDIKEFFRPTDNLWKLAKRIFCADGGANLRRCLGLIPEPAIKEILVPPPETALSASELSRESKILMQVREDFLDRWHATTHSTATGLPVDVLVLPSGGHVAPPHSSMEYFLYEAISNILNWPCGTIPVGNVDRALDPKPAAEEAFIPMSPEDTKNRAKYCPTAYENGAVCLQLMAPAYREEVVLASMRVVDEALGRGPEYMA